MEIMSNVQCLKKYLELNAAPIPNPEFMTFWKSCTKEQIEDYCRVAAAVLGVERK